MVQLSLFSLLACSTTFVSAQWWNDNNKGAGNRPNSAGNGWGAPQNSRSSAWSNAPAQQTQPAWNNAPSPTQNAPNCAVSVYVYTAQAGGAGGQKTSTQIRTHLVQTALTQMVNGPYQDIIVEERNGKRETITRTRTGDHPVIFQTVAEEVKTRTIIEGGGGGGPPVLATSTVTSCR